MWSTGFPASNESIQRSLCGVMVLTTERTESLGCSFPRDENGELTDRVLVKELAHELDRVLKREVHPGLLVLPH